MLQLWLPAEFLVEYYTKNVSRTAEADHRGGQCQGAGGVMLCLCLGGVLKDILIIDKKMPLTSLPALSIAHRLLAGFCSSHLLICQEPGHSHL